MYSNPVILVKQSLRLLPLPQQLLELLAVGLDQLVAAQALARANALVGLALEEQARGFKVAG